MTVLVRLGSVAASRRYAIELVRPSSVAVVGGSASATITALGSTDFTTCENIKVNGVFSAEYDNYMIVLRHVGSSASAPAVLFRYTTGGAEASGSNYTNQYLYAFSTTVGGTRETSQSYGRLGSSVSTQRSGITAYFYGPYLAQPTASRSVGVEGVDSARVYDLANTHSLSTAYDGILLSVGPDTFTGNVAVYGLRG